MKRTEAGFTLTELLVVLVIMPLIIGAIIAVVVTGLLNQNQASTRLADSASANITTAYFVRDVESSQFVTTDAALATTTNNTPPCGYNPTSDEYYDPFAAPPAWVSAAAPSVSATPTFALGLSWNGNGPDTPSSTDVSYSTWSNGDLVRLSCDAVPADPPSSVIVASGLLQPTTPCTTAQATADPLTCFGATVAITPSAAAETASAGWAAAAANPPISGVSLDGLTSSTNYNFNLVAVPRLSNPQNQGVVAGQSPSQILQVGQLTCSAGTLNVNGSVALTSGALSSHAQVNVSGQIYAATGAISVTPDASLSPTPIPPVGSPVNPVQGINPPVASILGPAPSSTTALNSSGQQITTYYPGVYSAQLFLNSFQQGVLSPGVYYLQGGLKIQDSATLSSLPGGVLIYLQNGVSVTNSAQLTLAAPTSGSYSGIGLWDFDGSPINLSGSSSISGVLYAPGSTVSAGDGADLSIGAMVSLSLACPLNGLITIG